MFYLIFYYYFPQALLPLWGGRVGFHFLASMA